MQTDCRGFLGILSLDTAFPRIKGDVGNADSYPFPVRVEIVEGADSTKIVLDGKPDRELVQRFMAAAQKLERDGARAIISTCGFLVSVQEEIAKTVQVPVLLSALSLFPMIQTACPGRVGILTASKDALGTQALAAANIMKDQVAITGLEDVGLFRETFLADKLYQNVGFDRALMEAAIVEKALAMTSNNPDLSAILLECGNLPPYAGAIEAATGKPVFHLVTAAHVLMR